MAKSRSHTPLISATGQNLLRIVIASYFVAIACGLIPGTDTGILFTAFLPEPLAYALGSGLTLTLALMILMGFFLRTCVLLLSLGIFWSSYLKALELGLADQLGHFWRDLALIAALMLTYIETEPRSARRRQMIRKKAPVRKVPFGKRPKRIATGAVPAPGEEPLLLTDPVPEKQPAAENVAQFRAPSSEPDVPDAGETPADTEDTSERTGTDGKLSPQSFLAGPYPVRPKEIGAPEDVMPAPKSDGEAWSSGRLRSAPAPDLIDEKDLPKRRARASISGRDRLSPDPWTKPYT